MIVALLAFAMGIHNALMRKHGVPDIATNVLTLTLAGLMAESRWAGGRSPHWQRRLLSILLFVAPALLAGGSPIPTGKVSRLAERHVELSSGLAGAEPASAGRWVGISATPG